MVHIWDYDIEELKKTEEGRILILERQIQFGVDWKHGEKINLADVKKYWDKLQIDHRSRRLLQLLIEDK